MSPKEKRLLKIALFIFAVYFLPFEMYPLANTLATDKYTSIQKRKADVQRLRRLIGQKDSWQTEYQQMQAREQVVEAALLKGASYNLVATHLQDILNQAADTSKLKIRSLEITEYSELRHWLLISQNLRFQASSQQLYDFISAIKAHETRLNIVLLSVQVGRTDQLEGSLTVTGISHLVENDAS